MSAFKNFFAAWVLGTMCVVYSLRASADDLSEAIGLVQNAEATFQDFAMDPNMQWFRDNVGDAKALVIVPQLLKAGFIFGASGGNAVVLARDQATGTWTNPAFYSVGSVTWGLQIGGELAQAIMLVMTEGGMHSLLSTKLQLGGDVSIAAGPVGAGAQAATVDILEFTRNQGVYGGLTLEGAVIFPRNDLTSAFYARTSNPVDVLIRHEATRNPYAEDLRKLILRTTAKK